MGSALTLSAHDAIEFTADSRIHILESAAAYDIPAAALVSTAGRLPRLAVGTILTPPTGSPALQIIGVSSRPGSGDTPASRLLCAKALTPGSLAAGETVFSAQKTGLALAWITLSDKGSQGLRADAAGPAIAAACAESLTLCLTQGHILPDEPGELKALLVDLALTQGFDLVVTTGGTGLSPRDSTPEATQAVIEKRLPGFETAMLLASLAKTKHAMLSRAVAGTLGQAIVVNVPGSPKAVRETLAAILPAIPHGLDKLRGDPADCAQL